MLAKADTRLRLQGRHVNGGDAQSIHPSPVSKQQDTKEKSRRRTAQQHTGGFPPHLDFGASVVHVEVLQHHDLVVLHLINITTTLPRRFVIAIFPRFGWAATHDTLLGTDGRSTIEGLGIEGGR